MIYKTPGVYVEEITKFPPSIAQVPTAIPAFIGYTEKAVNEKGDSLINKPTKIRSLLEYEILFGGAAAETGFAVTATEENNSLVNIRVSLPDADRKNYHMYYTLQMFFANGGGECYIVSVGGYQEGAGVVSRQDLEFGGDPEAATPNPLAGVGGLEATKKVDEITLLVFPDAVNLTTPSDYYGLHEMAIRACADLQDRFTVMDVYINADSNDPDAISYIPDNVTSGDNAFRNVLNLTNKDLLKYAAIYFPLLETTIDFEFEPADVGLTITAQPAVAGEGPAEPLPENLEALLTVKNSYYYQILDAIRNFNMVLPASGAMVGIYAATDASRGVWKAPANVGVANAVGPVCKVSDKEQEELNVDVNGGKSVNVIRSFTGRGPAIVWGARTLAGNDNEWRYISVRRFFNMVEESVQKANQQFVFEPNDPNTWIRVRAMISNFLTQQWRAGALMGSTPKEAFFVRVGLGETMTELDILEGRMIVEIGMAVVRPAEFIILKFSHKMLSES